MRYRGCPFQPGAFFGTFCDRSHVLDDSLPNFVFLMDGTWRVWKKKPGPGQVPQAFTLGKFCYANQYPRWSIFICKMSGVDFSTRVQNVDFTT